MEGESEAELHPGDICAYSGLYEVTHQAHRPLHRVVVVQGDTFPRCKHCGDAVRFHLIMRSFTEQAQPRAKAARKRSSG
jgi:hypothetical protein